MIGSPSSSSASDWVVDSTGVCDPLPLKQDSVSSALHSKQSPHLRHHAGMFSILSLHRTDRSFPRLRSKSTNAQGYSNGPAKEREGEPCGGTRSLWGPNENNKTSFKASLSKVATVRSVELCCDFISRVVQSADGLSEGEFIHCRRFMELFILRDMLMGYKTTGKCLD